MAKLPPKNPNLLRFPIEGQVDPTHLDVSTKADVVPDLLNDAATRGRADLVGLSWNQDGLTYVVSAYDELPKSRRVESHRDRVPRPKMGTGGSVGYAPERKLHGPVEMRKTDWPGFRRNRHYKIEDYLLEKRTVDVYDEAGNLVDIKSFMGEQLMDDLSRHNNIDKAGKWHIDRFEWRTPNREAPMAERNPADVTSIPVPLTGPDNVFGQVMDHHRQLKDRADGRFEDWVGLTWVQDGIKHQVVRDTIISDFGKSGPRPQRTWVVKSYDTANRSLGRTVYKDAALRKYFEEAEAINGKPLSGLHWETSAIAPVIKRPEQLTWAGWLATHPASTATPSNKDKKRSRQMLAYQDIKFNNTPEGKAYRDALAYFLNAFENRKFVPAFSEVITKYGYQTVFSLAKDLSEQYVKSVSALGLPSTNPDQVSISNITWGLAQEYYHSTSSSPAGRTSQLAYTVGRRSNVLSDQAESHIDPFGTSLAATARRREIIDVSVGSAFLRAGLDMVIDGKPRWTRSGKQTVDLKAHIFMKPDVEEKLQEFVKPEVMEIVQPIIDGEKGIDDLPLDDLRKLGRLLREQIIQ
jgi:hypothetical protein